MGKRSLIEPLPSAMLARIKEGLLTLTPAEYVAVKAAINARTFKAGAMEIGVNYRTLQQHLLNVTNKCGCETSHLIRAAFALDDDPDLMHHLAKLPAKRNSGRPIGTTKG
jgi:uncharacterized membrane protein